MAKKDVSKAITKVSPGLAVPKFMAGEEVTGLELLKQFIVPPFIKIIQKSAGEELLKSFSAGDVILSPANAMIAEMPRDNRGKLIEGGHASFQVVPILFYPEWLTWNPIELKGSEPAIRYRTLDENDPIVAKSRSAQLRKEAHPTHAEMFIRHVEHLNFLVILHSHALGSEPAILSFSRGEWRSGCKFASLIKMRKAPIYGCIFDAVVSLRHGAKGDWFGFDMANPEEGGPWVEKDAYASLKVIHEEFVQYHKDQRVRAQYEVVSETDEAATKPTDDF